MCFNITEVIFNNMKKPKLSWNKVLLITALLAIEITISILTFKFTHPDNHSYNWFSGCSCAIAEAMEAIEAYNSVNPQNIIKELNDENLLLLKRNKFLANTWPYKTPFGRLKCKYLTNGELDKDGFIYCEYHGSVNYKEYDGKCDFIYIRYLDIKGSSKHYINPNYGLLFEIKKGIGKKGYIEWKYDEPYECKYNINKVEIPPSKEYYNDLRKEEIMKLLNDYGIHFVFIVLIIIVIFA